MPLFSLPVLARGPGWIAVDKPGGISVHNDPGRDLCSLLTRQVEADPTLRNTISFDPETGLKPVHRLDQYTSGVMILAASADAARMLAAQFESRQVAKRYLAILHGELTPPEAADGWGVWDRPLTPKAEGRNKPAGKGKKVPCQTRYRIFRRTARYTLIECEPLTGRKHQIRRHARLAGHPVVGDARYGTPRSVKFLQSERDFNRLGLHAVSLTLQLPDRDMPETIRTDGMPPEMTRLLDADVSS